MTNKVKVQLPEGMQTIHCRSGIALQANVLGQVEVDPLSQDYKDILALDPRVFPLQLSVEAVVDTQPPPLTDQVPPSPKGDLPSSGNTQ